MRRATMARGYRAKQVSGFLQVQGCPLPIGIFQAGFKKNGCPNGQPQGGEGQKLYLAVSIMLRGLP